MAQINLALFIIWESGRTKENILLQEIKKKFIIRDIYEIKWSKENFANNLRRFYGPKLGNVEQKTKDCGIGPFLLVLVSDPNPKFGKRRTSLGMEIVNLNLYDNKRLFRRLTNKGYAIHSSLNDKETNDDLTLLLGQNTEDLVKSLPENWNGTIKKIELDLIGHNGWNNIEQLLYVLNSTINYVILRNFEDLKGNLSTYNHNDIDILTDDFMRIPYITNGGKSPFNNTFPTMVKIGIKKIPIDFTFPGDWYYDEKWTKDILKRRISHHGFYVPSKEDYFYSLFYHAAFYHDNIPHEYKKKLYKLAQELNINEISEQTLDVLDKSKEFVELYMKRMGYRHTNSLHYKINHTKIILYVKLSFHIWKKHGLKFLYAVIKGKIKRTILKSKEINEKSRNTRLSFSF
jgi:hypothetical protein